MQYKDEMIGNWIAKDELMKRSVGIVNVFEYIKKQSIIFRMDWVYEKAHKYIFITQTQVIIYESPTKNVVILPVAQIGYAELRSHPSQYSITLHAKYHYKIFDINILLVFHATDEEREKAEKILVALANEYVRSETIE